MIDQSQLKAIASCGKDNVRALFDQFKRELPVKVQLLEQHIERNEQQHSSEILHQLKGSLATLGMVQASLYAGELEALAKEQNLKEIDKLKCFSSTLQWSLVRHRLGLG